MIVTMACSKKPRSQRTCPRMVKPEGGGPAGQGRAGLREGQFLEVTYVWKHLEPLRPSHSEVTSEGPWHWLRVLGEAEGRAGLAGQQVGIAGSARKKLWRGVPGMMFCSGFLLAILAMFLQPRSVSQQMHAACPTFPAWLGRAFGGSRIKDW